MKLNSAFVLFTTATTLNLGRVAAQFGEKYCELQDGQPMEDGNFRRIDIFNPATQPVTDLMFKPGSDPKPGYFLAKVGDDECRLIPKKGSMCVPDEEHPPFWKLKSFEDRSGPASSLPPFGEEFPKLAFPGTKLGLSQVYLDDACGFVPSRNDCWNYDGDSWTSRTIQPTDPDPLLYPGGPAPGDGTMFDTNCKIFPADKAQTICYPTGWKGLYVPMKYNVDEPPTDRPFSKEYQFPGDTTIPDEKAPPLNSQCSYDYPDQKKGPGGPGKPTGYGDPHFKTWSGKSYDFHGGCDLVLLENRGFANGMGMAIHIRTKIRTSWSFIDSAVIQVGKDKLEVQGGSDGGSYKINGADKTHLETSDAALGDFPMHFKRINDHQTVSRVDIGNGDAISIETFKDFVRVNIGNKSNKSFDGSTGLLGRYPDGLRVGRDGATVFEDSNEFGQEWMVHPSDTILFSDVQADQLPLQCTMPDTNAAKDARRRLGESAIAEEEAALACARVSETDRDACIFDVMATNDKDMAGSY